MSFFKRYLILALLFLSLFLMFFIYTYQEKLKEEQSLFDTFTKESLALISLKERWKQGVDYGKIFKRLRAVAKPNKDEKDGLKHIFEYENLSQITLERIVRILFNSGLEIKEMKIEKNGDKISLHVEVKL